MEQIEQVYIEQPIYYKTINLVNKFRKLVFEKNVGELENWINIAKDLGIREINSFVNGLFKDLDAVKNAIICDYTMNLRKVL